DPQQIHGWLVPHEGATLVVTNDGGATWRSLGGPSNPQTVCFSEAGQGWVGTPDGVFVLRMLDNGSNWSLTLPRPDPQPGVPQATGRRPMRGSASPPAMGARRSGGRAASIMRPKPSPPPLSVSPQDGS